MCIREAQRTLAHSSKRLIESKIAGLGLGHGFRIFSDKIATPGDGIIIFRGMQDHTADSIKSLEGFRIAWIDEAQSLSGRSLALLRPTIRAEGSELWASWNPYNIPLAGGLDYWAATAPNTSFAFPIGQAISRTTYSALFALIGTTYGPGDGSTTFNLPDKTGRVSAMKEASAARLTSAYFGGNSTNLGATGGVESQTLTTAQLPVHSHANSLSDPGHSHQENIPGFGGGSAWNSCNSTTNSAVTFTNAALLTNSNATGITINNANAGSGNAHAIVQPTIVCNYIIRII
ncbi:phage terminase large subunit [mine drainage metagenome]|uniref:Phage terminase large subunit n=1 Tax=mine drainage metagenome TaxID=410659 RepID=A0A1J5P6P6_9ZZZZ